jgi:16S rRNA (adenine1518-N6/adenine1519-N6)-dimethyltransferase
MHIDQLKELLGKYNLKPNFTYGQNFLLDDFVLQDIVDDSGVGEGDYVLEIGPGIGTLTELLLKKAKFVLAVEKDPKFLPILRRLKKEYKNFHYEIADVLEYDFQKFFREQGASGYSVVANIPYYITGKIIQMLLTSEFKPRSITMLMQKEVAHNIVAEPGSLGILAISVQLYGDASLLRTVPARSFYPAPKVDSAVVQIFVDAKPKFKVADEKRFFKVLKACFAGKRKQLHNTLVNNLGMSKEGAEGLLKELAIDPKSRPQELTIQQWIDLAQKITNEENGKRSK